MLEHLVANRAAVERLRSGVIGAHLESFVEHLARLGYTPVTVSAQLHTLRRLDRWMARRRLGVADLREPVLARFLRGHARGARGHRGDAPTLRRFLAHLRERGATRPAPHRRAESLLGRLVGQYEHYLTMERGLAPATLTNYGRFVRQFLTERFGPRRMPLEELDAADIARFVLRHAHTMSPGRAKLMVTALRSLLRFLFARGAIARDLAACVPAVAHWRLATVPKYLRPEEVDRLLRTCNRTTAIGRRNYAVLLLRARLGLRAGEVVSLELDDIRWRAGELAVQGSKGHQPDRLPLPADVGEALAAYVHTDRPRHPLRRVFLCARAPRRGFAGPSTVDTIVQRAADRAGLHPPLKGAHLLRHSLATRLLREGASLPEIGQILRHRAVTTTEIYAKVDLAGLRALAQPWPGSGGVR
jgi:site-specific recombinase XerD